MNRQMKRYIKQGVWEGDELPCHLWAQPFPGTSTYSQAWKLSESPTPGALCGLYDICMIHHVDSLWSVSPFWRWGGKFQASNHGLLFQVTTLYCEAIQEHAKSCLIRTKDTPRDFGNSKGFRDSVSGTRQRPTIRTKDAPNILIT